MNTMRVARFSSVAKAEPIQQRLVRAGVQATLHDELVLERLWFVSRRQTGVRVEVPAKDFEGAEQLLLDWDAAEGALQEAIRCPECKSLRVDFPQYAHNSLLTNLAIGFISWVGSIEREYYCEDCQFTWPKEGVKRRKDRPHMAPYYFIEGVEQTSLNKSVPELEDKREAA